MVGATEISVLIIAALLFGATVACFAIFMLDRADLPRPDKSARKRKGVPTTFAHSALQSHRQSLG